MFMAKAFNSVAEFEDVVASLPVGRNVPIRVLGDAVPRSLFPCASRPSTILYRGGLRPPSGLQILSKIPCQKIGENRWHKYY